MDKKVAVVTGGAKGIGRAITEKFLKHNYRVVILDYDKEGGEVAKETLSQLGDVDFCQTDVTSYESLENARNYIISNYNQVQSLIINAGISQKKTIAAISIEDWNRVMSVNLNGSFYSLKAFYSDLIESKGKIVIISSGSGITGTGGGAHYAASKSGQFGLMRTASKELGPKGVNVNCIAPRVIRTDLFDTVLYPTQESRDELLEKIPIRRFGLPEDIANLALFLSSEESSYIHGQIIVADGGRTF
ncbi:SDR family NAD(P)-dependent oxidoreductase [Eremococcus coleocola]|uniref:Oxidoreductase, short chain dehydrogenase/reductase family protein n=1 Tax=Eremococcus coleocola ACS-139-V-Col8 TaxID=908337 RepID=E4KN73_9LACT|nr:SDR family NAD(P)-dependent oxidoreductase [Eremococcus coleocola]EFR31595.1 oxidoreductase, short chain dehydrogenase/reductase family protein [Eremococcus coleocola ACS-139-V-Col8]